MWGSKGIKFISLLRIDFWSFFIWRFNITGKIFYYEKRKAVPLKPCRLIYKSELGMIESETGVFNTPSCVYLVR